jgi:hypothetical protein
VVAAADMLKSTGTVNSTTAPHGYNAYKMVIEYTFPVGSTVYTLESDFIPIYFAMPVDIMAFEYNNENGMITFDSITIYSPHQLDIIAGNISLYELESGSEVPVETVPFNTAQINEFKTTGVMTTPLSFTNVVPGKKYSVGITFQTEGQRPNGFVPILSKDQEMMIT